MSALPQPESEPEVSERPQLLLLVNSEYEVGPGTVVAGLMVKLLFLAAGAAGGLFMLYRLAQ